MTWIAFLAFVCLLALSKSAFAYLDPGSGSIVLQVLLGGVAGFILIVKLFWHRILAIFGIRKEEQKTLEGSESESPHRL
jgi:hypothetical protein